jgi:hypothetical protein
VYWIRKLPNRRPTGLQNNTPYKKICPEIPNNIRQSKKITIGMDERSNRTWEGYLLRDALLSI